MSLEKTTRTKSPPKSKNPDHNTAVKVKEGKVSPKSQFEEYFSLRDRSNCVLSESGAEKLAQRMIEWVEEDTPNALTLNQFYRSMGMLEMTFHRLMKRFPVLRDAHDYALAAIGDKREIGALLKKYDGHTVGHVMVYYSKVHKWVEEWRADLRNKNDVESSQKITVVLEAFPASPLVPERKASE